mmetsp:Transcript_122796/g.348034  ORF Transcript_122796/g.348034 Transcript_122796/m.348034 type:complete len:290 (+) Transcript_122796:874-1743(+)
MFWLLAHFDDASSVIRDGPEHVHGEHKDNRRQHAHGRHRRPGQPGVRDAAEGGAADLVGREQRARDDEAGRRGGAHAHRHASDHVRAVTGHACLGDLPDGLVLEVRVVLCDQDEEEGGAQAYEAADREVHPRIRVLRRLEEEAAEDHHADSGQGHRDLVTTFEDLHGIDVPLALGRLGDHDAYAADDQIHGMYCQWEEHEATLNVCWKPLGKATTENHGRNDLPGYRLEEVRATSRTVPHVVSDEVSDDGWIPRIILRDVGLYFPNHVRANVGGLRVNAASQLCKEGDK